MKKLFTMLAVAALTAQGVSAQTVQESKTFDNWYIGINGGANLPGCDMDFGNVNFDAGLRIGRWITPVVGFAFEGQAYFGENAGWDEIKTFVKASNVSALGTINFSNWFGGYPGTPRSFEVIGLGGFGWWHDFGLGCKSNSVTSKLALDFAFNFGADKQWQFYVEPNIVYHLINGYQNGPIQYNFNNSLVGLNIGLNYKFGNSNGTHNFKIVEARDQAEIDALNAKINALRSDVDAKNGQLNAANQTIDDLKKKLAECEARPKVVEKKAETVLQPIVIFRQGKSVIDAAQYANVEMVAKYMRNHPDAKVLVKGYASPEGSTELNQRLSEARAKAVADALVKRYKIDASRITTQGFGETSELSEENDFNRVAMFVDTTK
ncbi:MAG: OmpA family protein [Prevotella sp.]|nr:OmpA family protein [Prevotella sp.]